MCIYQNIDEQTLHWYRVWTRILGSVDYSFDILYSDHSLLWGLFLVPDKLGTGNLRL